MERRPLKRLIKKIYGLNVLKEPFRDTKITIKKGVIFVDGLIYVL
jgi:hypothetical protein